MQGHQYVVAGPEPQVLQRAASAGPVQVGQQRVHHDVAHQVDLVGTEPFGLEVGDRVR